MEDVPIVRLGNIQILHNHLGGRGGHQMITFDYRGEGGSANDYMITGGEGGHQNIT